MIHHVVASASGKLLSLLAELDGGSAVPLLQRLEPYQRVRVMAALAVILTFGGLMLLVVRAGARVARWYIQRPVGCTQLARCVWQIDRGSLRQGEPYAPQVADDSPHPNRPQPPLDA